MTTKMRSIEFPSTDHSYLIGVGWGLLLHVLTYQRIQSGIRHISVHLPDITRELHIELDTLFREGKMPFTFKRSSMYKTCEGHVELFADLC